MRTGPRFTIHRRALLAALCLASFVALLATGGGAPQSALAAAGPDVTVFSFTDIGNYGSSGGFVGYAVGTRSCNRGDTPLNWCDQSSGCAAGATTRDHPVIAQNLYRIKSGRFEQIGMSWLKHGFTSTNSTTGGCAGVTGAGCTGPPAGGNQLGIGCTDPYTSSLNGSRPLGRRSEVDATSGAFPFPPSSPGGPYQAYDQRIKVPTSDVDAGQNAGATYWAEAQYIANDDAAAGNSLNNASYRRVTVGASPNYALSMTGTFFERQPAIYAWKSEDPTVILVNADLKGTITQRYHVGRKVTDLGGGQWHYEYAVHNLNSDRSARGFEIQFPAATTFTNAGFKDIETHSGEPYVGTDWTLATTADKISWTTDTFATDQNANALRFGTMYNFWFDANQSPADEIVHTIDLFRPGTPDAFTFAIGADLFKDSFETGDIGNWNGG